MLGQEPTADLIQTKLHRPPLPVDLVPRRHLTEWLERRRSRPLTLVSAPAGYGKSTLISCWLQSADCPAGWLSLDTHDNELGTFLRYFLAAIQTIFPTGMPETQALLQATLLPPISTIAALLINEINQIKEPFILVLDDYHLIETQAIRDLLNELLLHPPRNLHLVLGTRMDPFLPLVTLRAGGRLTEIRSQDLRFSIEETELLFQKLIPVHVDRATIIELDAQAEGWVTGLRMAALAIRHRLGRESLHRGLTVHNRYVTEYLLTEILAKQAATLSDCMLRTSILERFCADLCEAVCVQGSVSSERGSEPADFSGERFLAWLQASNLFTIPLDERGEWFRYHHIFRDFLREELASRFGPEEIAKLQAAAGRWYAQNGWIEEGLYHLLAANDPAAAIELVAQHRFRMMNTTQWPRLEQWLKLFPAEVVETSAELAMLKTWLVYHQGRYAELPALLSGLASLTDQEKDTPEYLEGETSALRSLILYHDGDAQGTIYHARRALEILPPDLWIVRVLARMQLAGGLLLQGEENGGNRAIYGAFEEEKYQDRRFHATLLMTACYFHWVTADLESMAQAAKRSITLCQETGHQQILGLSNYHLGCVHYQQNNLTSAEALFASVVTRPYRNYGTCYIDSANGLAMTYQALGREDEARTVGEEAIGFLLETGNTAFLPNAQAGQAEVALRQGRLAAASQWAKKLDPVPRLEPVPWFSSLYSTLVKVWLAQNTTVSLGRATELLSQLQEYLEGTHNTRFLIEALALRALLEESLGDRAAALAALEDALRLAQPGGFIRLFVDLGPQMATLLPQLRDDRDLGGYVGQIRSAFPESPGTAPSLSRGDLLEPLTNREVEVLELLGERLTNKEIAAQLVISPATVKGHTIQIYDKLDVKGRRQAVEKAIALGMLPPK